MLVTEEEKIKIYYQALLERKQSFVGMFYVGVKTTSVFCISTCRARKPKFENVEFYTTFKEALSNGYRPCKICKPTENANRAPKSVELAIKMVKENPKEKISDCRLRAFQISPELLRRWFKKNYGMTFQAYQRMYRINTAFQELKKGKKTVDTAFDTGYESLSGFGYTYKKLIGKSPQQSKTHPLLLISRLTSPLGPMFVCASDKGICLLEFVDRKILEKEFKDLQQLLKAKIIAGDNEFIRQAKKELAEYFEGKRKNFEVPLDTPGTLFQNVVWESLKELPYGHTATYEEQAEKIQQAKAVRALAAANAANRIAIMIPGHRLIGKENQLRAYGGGLERKRWLINHEKGNI